MTQLCKIFSAVANLQENPGSQIHIGKNDSQMLHGETFLVQSQQNGWSYGTSELDGYTGWIEDVHLRPLIATPTHAVGCLMTNAYATPDFKTQPAQTFSFMSRVIIDQDVKKDGFVMLRETGLWVPENHLIALDALTANPADIVDTALMFMDCPYVYGGRGAWGIDCSGMVQLALQRNGINCPRDSGQQSPVIGQPVPLYGIKGGDIVFFPGHVGIMKDDLNFINATTRHMKVVIEPLDDLISVYGPVTAARRIDTPSPKLLPSP